jgi:hypothetical protein
MKEEKGAMSLLKKSNATFEPYSMPSVPMQRTGISSTEA